MEDKNEWVEKMYWVLQILNKGQYIAPINMKQQVSIENNSELINDCKEELADHEYRISVLEGVPIPINARRNPSGR